MPGRRRLILLGLSIVDIGLLSLATAWVVTRGTAPAGAVATSAIAAGPSGAGATASVGTARQPSSPTSTPPVPTRASSASDRRLNGGPKFCVATAVDHEGNVWIGTEDQGVWCSQGGDNWLSYGLADGLADTDATAVACDALGRVWVGHADHGLSIFNGQEWRSYTRFDGPGASHIFCLATCPTDGDVWMGTDAGLARYSLKADRWALFDRSNGLPAAQVNCLAFDAAGNLYAGLGAEGIGIAHPSEGYATWTHVTGPADLPIVASGPGLPSSIVNVLLVLRDDTVLAGTAHGLARSVDHGASWTYVRGHNWADLARGRNDGVPAEFTGKPESALTGDWITALAQDPAGALWVGFREGGFQSYPNLAARADYSNKGRATTLAFTSDGAALIGTYGNGVSQCGVTYAADAGPAGAVKPSATTGTFPTPAPPADAAQLDALRRQVEALPPPQDGVDFLGDDWSTEGNWCGRYGHVVRWLLGLHNFTPRLPPGYDVSGDTGPYRLPTRYSYWIEGKQNGRGLLDPRRGEYAFCEYNDGGWMEKEHPRTVEGPDLFLTVTVPAGVHRVALYFDTFDGHNVTGGPFCRDYPVLVKRLGAATDDDGAVNDGAEADYLRHAPREDLVAAELAPTLAGSRAWHYWRPVYKQFLIRGAGRYAFKVARNGSDMTKVNGLFIDRLDRPSGTDDATYPGPPSGKNYTADPGVTGAAARLWAALDAAVGRPGYAGLADRARGAAYGAAAAAGVDTNTLARWRWQAPLWLADDQRQFDLWLKSLPKPAPEK